MKEGWDWNTLAREVTLSWHLAIYLIISRGLGFEQCIPLIHHLSKILNRLSKTMHMQLALEKKERLSPSPCMHTASIWGEGKFCLDREFSRNAPLFHRHHF